MSRLLAGLSVVVVGALLWLALAWRAPTSDLPVAIDPPPAEPPPLPPSPAAPPAEPAPQPTAPVQPEPAEAPTEEPTEPAQENAPYGRAPDELIRGDQGPVAEYRKQYAVEARNAVSAGLEKQLREGFLASEGGANLIQSVSCRATLCKIEMRWSMANMRAYIAGLTRSRDAWEMPVAVSPVGPKDERGERPVEVYLKRRTSTGSGH